LIISAAIRPGLEVEQKVQADWLGETGTLLGTGDGYDFTAAFRYVAHPGLALEAGYLNQSFGWQSGGETREDTFSQFYAGVSLSF
jgi:hypothetical protein